MTFPIILLEHALARRAVQTLREAGLEVWWSEDSVLPGDNWATEYGKVLEESQAMIILLSDAASKSKKVLADLSFALGSKSYKDRLIPVLRHSSDLDVLKSMPWILKRLKTITLDNYPHSTTLLGIVAGRRVSSS